MIVSQVTLHCDRQTVWVQANGNNYLVNGTSMIWLKTHHPELHIRDLEQIWRFDDAQNKEFENITGENPGLRISIFELIDDGLALCE